MKKRNPRCDENTSTPEPKKKKAPRLLIAAIAVVLVALIFCLVMLNSMIADAIDNLTDRNASVRKPAATEAPAKEAPPAEAATEAAPAAAETADEITLWTYPIGSWGDQATVAALAAQFQAETGIRVNVEFLTYIDGDDKVETAIMAGAAPDLILEGPERLVAKWGANGYLADLSNMYDSTDLSEIQPTVLNACFANDGNAYMYPLAMTVHTMAINKSVFEAAGQTASGDEILFMAFPSLNAYDSQLCGGIWGFGIFDNGDPSRIQAARQFVRYMCDSPATFEAVKASGYFPVRTSAEGTDLSRVWESNPIMAEYQKLMPMLGDYYNVIPGWSNARIQWWNMLQDVNASDGYFGTIHEIVGTYVNNVNK